MDAESKVILELWEFHRARIVLNLMRPKWGKTRKLAFTRRGAQMAAENFIQSMAFAKIPPTCAAEPKADRDWTLVLEDAITTYFAALPKQEPSNDQQGCCPCENPLNHIEGCRNAHNSPK